MKIKLNEIPGFRTGVLWKKIIAITLYFFIILLFITIRPHPDAVTYTDKIISVIGSVSVIFLWIIIPIILITNFKNIRKQLPIFKTGTFAFNLLGGIIVVFALLFITLVGDITLDSFESNEFRTAKQIAFEARQAERAEEKALKEAEAEAEAKAQAKAEEKALKEAEAEAEAKAQAEAEAKAKAQAKAEAEALNATGYNMIEIIDLSSNWVKGTSIYVPQVRFSVENVSDTDTSKLYFMVRFYDTSGAIKGDDVWTSIDPIPTSRQRGPVFIRGYVGYESDIPIALMAGEDSDKWEYELYIGESFRGPWHLIETDIVGFFENPW